jgi:hypothetical protein
MRSFWGTPITTASHHKIGVLWMLDDKVRPELKNDDIRFIGQVLALACLLTDTDGNNRTMTSLVMQNLESRKESIERRRILRMAKAIDSFIDGGQRDHDSRNRNSPATDASRAQSYSSQPENANQTEDDFASHLPNRDLPIMVSSTKNGPDADTTREESAIASKATATADDENIDSKDKRDRDLVYARASYLIREGLAMQGW